MHVQSYTFNLTDSSLHLDKMYPPYPHYLRYKDLLQGRERRIYQLAFDSIWQHWPLTPTPPHQPFWRSARRSIILLPSYLGCTERCHNHYTSEWLSALSQIWLIRGGCLDDDRRSELGHDSKKEFGLDAINDKKPRRHVTPPTDQVHVGNHDLITAATYIFYQTMQLFFHLNSQVFHVQLIKCGKDSTVWLFGCYF